MISEDFAPLKCGDYVTPEPAIVSLIFEGLMYLLNKIRGERQIHLMLAHFLNSIDRFTLTENETKIEGICSPILQGTSLGQVS